MPGARINLRSFRRIRLHVFPISGGKLEEFCAAITFGRNIRSRQIFSLRLCNALDYGRVFRYPWHHVAAEQTLILDSAVISILFAVCLICATPWECRDAGRWDWNKSICSLIYNAHNRRNCANTRARASWIKHSFACSTRFLCGTKARVRYVTFVLFCFVRRFLLALLRIVYL